VAQSWWGGDVGEAHDIGNRERLRWRGDLLILSQVDKNYKSRACATWEETTGVIRVLRCWPCNASSKAGETPKRGVMMQGSVKFARFLVEHGADATARDHYGWTPLHCTLQIESVDLARLLIERGADMAAQDNNVGSMLGRITTLVPMFHS
jgi:ankyrin repeat protein